MVITGIALVVGLSLTSLYSYLLFHGLAEMFSIAIAFGIFMIAWNSRRTLDNGYLLILGIAYLFIGLIDLIHTLSFKGMGVFVGYGANLPTQLWLAARSMEAATLILAALMIPRKPKPVYVISAYSCLTAILLTSIFIDGIFPTAYIDGQGLTPFKIYSEYVIIAGLIVAGYLLYKGRKSFDPTILRLIGISIALTIGSEFMFTTHVSVYDTSNLVGHLFKIGSFYTIYLAIIKSGIEQPFTVLFRNVKESEERLSVTLRSIGDGVISTDIEGKITLMNEVAEELTGWKREEAMGKSVQDVFHIVNRETRKLNENPIERAIKSGKVVGLADHTVLISKDGTERDLADTGSPIRNVKGETIGAVLVFRDITKEIRMEEEMVKAERLQSVGLLAGGIAHDFNNILTAVQGNISMAEARARDDYELAMHLAEAEKASERAMDLTKQLLIFSKGGEPVKKVLFAGDLIKDATKLALSGASVKPIFSIPTDLWPIEGDEGQLRQAFMNMVVNAKEAMAGGGVIEVMARNVDDKEGCDPAVLTPHISISVKDHGMGISRENLVKIFEPYFTTKATGHGLGLSIVNSIVKKHDGSISVQSVIGVGTTFTICLPASEKMPEAVVEAPVEQIRGSGRVLWMDDNDAIRDLAEIMLRSLGYEPAIAKNGEEAINLYKEAIADGCPFDAVILDLTVPGGMGGKETIKRLLEMDSEVRAVVCSGYSDDKTLSQFRENGFIGSLLKPFKLQELGSLLKEVMTK